MGVQSAAGLGFLVVLAGAAWADGPDRFEVKAGHEKVGTLFFIGDKKDTVTFKSQAPLEDIVGTTGDLTGYVAFDPAKPQRGAKGLFKVPVKSLDTGIPTRNEHMFAAQWLDAATYPEIRYEITGIKGVRSSRPDVWELTMEGTLTLHGVSKPLAVPAKVAYLKASDKTKMRAPGNLLTGRASFEVPLKDFGIAQEGGPAAIVGSKIAEAIAIEVSFVGSDVRPAK